MKISTNPRETRTCAARVDSERGRRAARRGGRCGSAAQDYGDVRIAGLLVEIPLCQVHFRMLRDSPSPSALRLTWAVDPPAPQAALTPSF